MKMDINEVRISPEVYNIWINDNRTVKKRIKDMKKCLKKMLKRAKKK